MSAPFTLNSYTEKLIKDQQDTRLSEVVMNDPSVRSAVSPYYYQENLFIRGVSFNGRDVAFNGLYGLTGGRTIDIVGAERIEILHGPAAFAFGFAPTGTVAGVINIVPKRANDIPTTEVGLHYLSSGNVGSSFDVGRRYGEKKEWGLRVNGLYTDGELPIQGSSQRHGAVSSALDYRGERFRATFDFGYANWLWKTPVPVFGVNPGFQIPRAPDLSKQIAQPWGRANSEHIYGATRLEYDLAPTWTIYGAAGAARVNESFFYDLPTITNAAGDLTNGRLSSGTFGSGQIQKTAEAGIRGKFYIGPIQHSVLVSGNGYWQEYPFESAGGAVPFASNLYNPTFVAAPPNLPRAPFNPSFNERHAVTFADTMSMFDGKLELTGGVRQQWVNTSNYTTLGAVLPGYRQEAASPLGAILIRPIKELSLYASYAEGFSNGPTAPATAANAGQIFPPVISKQVEAGVKLDYTTIGASAAVFQIELPSAFQDPVSRIYGILGLQVNKGLEFNVFGSPIEGVRFLGGFQVVDGKLERTLGGLQDGRTAPGVPRFQAVGSAEYDLPFIRGLTATGRVIYTDGMYYDPSNLQSIPSWVRFDLGARYVFEYLGTRFTTRFGVENVAGANYWAYASAGLLSLGTPRTYKLSLTANF